MPQSFRQFGVEGLNQLIDLLQPLIEDVQRLMPFVSRVVPIDAAATARQHHPLVGAAHSLPRDLGFGANLHVEFHEVRTEALLFDQLLQRIRAAGNELADRVVDQIRRWHEVEQSIDPKAVERLTAIARALRWAGALAFAVLVGATLVIVSATLQLAIYARREEVEIQKLVGATSRFVQAPFLVEGALQGLAGAVLPVLALLLFRQLAAPQLASLFSFLRLPGHAPSSGLWLEALELAVAGALLGLAGSYLAVLRFLRA